MIEGLAPNRPLERSKTGGDFIQTHGIPNFPGLTRGNYFATLSSKRRLGFMKDLARNLRAGHLPALRAHDDLLSSFPELEGWEVWAADGHKIGSGGLLDEFEGRFDLFDDADEAGFEGGRAIGIGEDAVDGVARDVG